MSIRENIACSLNFFVNSSTSEDIFVLWIITVFIFYVILINWCFFDFFSTRNQEFWYDSLHDLNILFFIHFFSIFMIISHKTKDVLKLKICQALCFFVSILCEEITSEWIHCISKKLNIKVFSCRYKMFNKSLFSFFFNFDLIASLSLYSANSYSSWENWATCEWKYFLYLFVNICSFLSYSQVHI